MGCDIHMYLEVKRLKLWPFPRKWEMVREIEVERNYTLFAALCGVHSHTESPVCVSPPKDVPKDVSPEVAAIIKQWEGDGHHHSYNTLKELKAFDNRSPFGDFREIIPKMEGTGCRNVRIVYFFDN